MGNCLSPASQKPSNKRAVNNNHNQNNNHQATGSTAATGSRDRRNNAPPAGADKNKDRRYGKDAYAVEKDLETKEGSESRLRLMRNKATGELVAAKWVPREAGAALSTQTEREIINHRKLRHPNIVCFREVYTTDSHLVIVMEYVAGGRFERFLQKQGRLPEREARRYFGQLIDAVAYCHEQGVYHRSLNMSNLLVEPQDKGPMVLKVSDFAYSKNALLDSCPKTMIGDFAFTCPELLLGLRLEDGTNTGRTADVWACGVILYYMLTGRLPFQDPNKPQQLTKDTAQSIVKGQWSLPTDVQISPSCQDLLTAIFTVDAKTRITAEEIKTHAWFSSQPEALAAPVNLPPMRQTVTEIREIIERARKRREEMAKRREQQHPQSARS